MADLISEFRLGETHHALARTPEEAKAAEREANLYRNAIDSTMADYVTLVGENTFQEDITDFYDAWKIYRSEHDK